jgi:hypothetical protein
MAIKRVTDIIIAKDVSSGDGFISLVKDDQSALTGTPTIATSPVIYVKQGLAGGKTRLSLPIHGANVRKWSGRSAANGTVQITTITSINALNDQEYGLYITVNSDKEMAQGNRRYYAQFVSDSSGTAAEIAAGMVAAINASEALADIVTASTTGTDIVITGNNCRTYFSVGRAIGFDASIVITATQTADPGHGTYDTVLELEEIAKGYLGYLGERRTFRGNMPGMSSPVYFAAGTALSATGVYDVYIIDHDQPIDLQGTNSSEGKPTTTYICVPAGPSTFNQGAFESVINSWMASTPGAFANVNL